MRYFFTLTSSNAKSRQVVQPMTEVETKLIDITALPFVSANLWPMRLTIRDGVPSYKIRESIYTELEA